MEKTIIGNKELVNIGLNLQNEMLQIQVEKIRRLVYDPQYIITQSQLRQLCCFLKIHPKLIHPTHEDMTGEALFKIIECFAEEQDGYSEKSLLAIS